MNEPKAQSLAVHQLEFLESNALSIPMYKVLKQDGTLYKGAKKPAMDEATARRIYDNMVYIRVLDERMIAAQRQGRISFYMTCIGEEAAIIASAVAIDDQDMVFAQYREQGALRARGFTTEQFMNQNFSNELDLGKGRQMPIHYGSNALHYMTISSPLATQIPQATGYAYAQKIRKTGQVTICYFGEGAASEGDFHAGLNMAAVHGAPVIFFCRNNGYAISTPSDEQFKGDGIASRGVGYGMRTIRVDGNDTLAVYHATVEARRYAVEHSKPVLIEAMTYRLGAHSTSDDPTGYRSKEEEAVWAKQDPVLRFKHWMVKNGWWSDAEEKAVYSKYRDEILSQLKVSEKVLAPALEEMFTDVYDEMPQHLTEQYEELKAHIKRYPDVYPKTSGRLDA